MSDRNSEPQDAEVTAEIFAEIPPEKLAFVRHELRTPINAIVGYSEMLLEDFGAENEEILPDLERVHRAGKRLLGMIDQFLTPGKTAKATPDWKSQAKTPTAPRPHLAETQKEAPLAPISGYLLIVDDIESNRDYLSRRLLRQGYQVGTAEDGSQALEKMRNENFDLVLLDIMMPVMDGYETLAHLKADPNLSHIPVIMLTALDELESVVRCIEMGAEDYLPKLPNEVLLQARIGACLEKKRLRDQEIAYLRDVIRVTQAATAVESGTFDAGLLAEVGMRQDALGTLARIFDRMAKEVQAREQRLRQQVQQLKIEIDHQRREKQVAEITDTDYFQKLQQRAGELRKRIQE